ncbi:hypothetical protein [Pseudanabaena sp. PCC 6802]|uniref:hypothetical protein n=1 Tax=Pseudanabaena sp. PCC 6802 TaxID=118173 RepID=UPI00036BD46D|nr:hypothetical protein [Pseudanabaena sp. PCC 6802]
MKYNLHQLALVAGISLTTTLAAPTAEQQLTSNRYSDRVMLMPVCAPGSPKCDPEQNGTNLYGYVTNGASLNGTSFNGVNQNGANLNGTGWNQLTVTTANLKEMAVREIGLEGGQLVFHVHPNGTNLNGYAVNSLMPNGGFQNGTSFNGGGLSMNGVSLNGTGWTQLTVTTANLKEMSVREIGLEGGQLVLHLRGANPVRR